VTVDDPNWRRGPRRHAGRRRRTMGRWRAP